MSTGMHPGACLDMEHANTMAKIVAVGVATITIAIE